MQTSSPPVITPNRSQSNPDDMITLPRPIQSVGMDLHDVSGTSTGQTLPREIRARPGTHFCPTMGWVDPHSATIFILHPLLSTFSPTFVRNIPTFDHSSTLKRRPQTSVTARNKFTAMTTLPPIRRLFPPHRQCFPVNQASFGVSIPDGTTIRETGSNCSPSTTRKN